MRRTSSELRIDAERIWRAGVAAVVPEQLIPANVHIDADSLIIGDETVDLGPVERIAIVGAGKAAGAMAVALENVIGPRRLAEKRVVGIVNVPVGCIVPTQRVQLHAGRPAGMNEPRPEGVEGTRRILELVSSLGPNDLCICLLTGGGSALLPAPALGISLCEKAQVTRLLSAAGANIRQLNTVRRHLSLVKGGGLARACRAGRLITLLISDVLGDPLDVIASGPTVPSTTTAGDALAILSEFGLTNEPTIVPVIRQLHLQTSTGWLELSRRAPPRSGGRPRGGALEPPASRSTHHILANNATAVDAAGVEAERLGYLQAMISASQLEGPAEDVGRHLADVALLMRSEPGSNCLISGGEPTVALVDESRRGKGGRNQQLALATLTELGDCEGIALLSAGTDGEDGPTDAAGAFVTEEVVRRARSQKLDPQDYLARNDAYSFFGQAGGLFVTGPTQTNVCDLRVVTVNNRGANGAT